MLLLCCFVDSVNIKSPHSSSSRSESDKVSHLPEPVVKPCKLKLNLYTYLNILCLDYIIILWVLLILVGMKI